MPKSKRTLRLAGGPALLLVAALTVTGCGSGGIDLPARPSLSAPSGLRLIQSSPTGIQLFWEPVSEASSYRIYWTEGTTVSPETGRMLRSSTTTLLQSGLREGATYAYAVAAVDARDHEGRLSSVVTTTLGVTPHGAPQNVRATAGDAQVTIDWDRVPNASGYRVGVTSAQGMSTVVPDPAVPPIVHQKLLNRTTYTYTVQTKFGEQLGPPSLPVSATPMPTQPGIPLIIDVQIRTVAGFTAGGVASHGIVSLTWTAADHAERYQVYAKRNQGPEIPLIPDDHPLRATSFDHKVDYETEYEYRIEALNEGVASGRLNPPPVRAWVPRPLENGRPYYYLVRSAALTAVPRSGSSVSYTATELAASAEVSAVPRDDVFMTPPTGVTVVDTPRDSGNSLTMTWKPSTTRGITEQRLYRSKSGIPGSYTLLQTFAGNATSTFNDNTVTDGSLLFYALSAMAGDMESDLSAAASGFALSNSALVPPTDLSVTDTLDDSGGSLTVTWVPSTSGNVTAQRLYRSKDGGSYTVLKDLTDPLQDRFVDDQTVLAGPVYSYKIHALRDTQESAPSNQADGIARVNAEPFPPRSLQAADVPEDLGGVISLSWTPSVSENVTEHRLYRSTTSGGPYQLVAAFEDNVPSRYTDVGVPGAPSPTGLVVVPDGSDLLITWSPVAEAVDGYRLSWWEQDRLGGILSSGTESDIVTERFVHRDLTPGSRYVYAVQVRGYPAVSYPVQADAP